MAWPALTAKSNYASRRRILEPLHFDGFVSFLKTSQGSHNYQANSMPCLTSRVPVTQMDPTTSKVVCLSHKWNTPRPKSCACRMDLRRVLQSRVPVTRIQHAVGKVVCLSHGFGTLLAKSCACHTDSKHCWQSRVPVTLIQHVCCTIVYLSHGFSTRLAKSSACHTDSTRCWQSCVPVTRIHFWQNRVPVT